ncbi:hypothetical protein Tsubulata_036300 [Turnera subulata]|uniref:TF-B3 domain-containing protein n=1 Tax=Turnera subulata TaxID=218843 RepID=A0A9Q0GCQ0_9ROSI|nr:hypothetical protein Tsubulata_036300 [Turnera subulata]
MAKSKLSYEEVRKKRMEENKKRMEELNLKKLSQDLQAKVSKPHPAKQVKPRVPRIPVDVNTVRRSPRVADRPAVSYKDIPLEPLGRFRSYQRRSLLNRVYASDEVRQYAIERANQLQSGLDSDTPSFVKPMLQSHVTGGFWLGLPLHFCREHLPRSDEMMTLEDEDGDESEAKYLGEKNGLSGGWRGFAIDHELVDGDAVVFQLVNPSKFKVYIVRAYETEVNEDGTQNSDVTPTDGNVRRSRRISKQAI